MLSTGFTIFLGIGLILAKLPRRTMLKVLKHGLGAGHSRLVDYPDDSLGDIQRVMVATVAGLLTSVATSGVKRLIGFIDGDTYYPGRIRSDV